MLQHVFGFFSLSGIDFRSVSTIGGSATNVNTISVPLPAVYFSGDILVAGYACGADTNLLVPSGWSLAGTYNGMYVIWKISNGTEGVSFNLSNAPTKTTNGSCVSVALSNGTGLDGHVLATPNSIVTQIVPNFGMAHQREYGLQFLRRESNVTTYTYNSGMVPLALGSSGSTKSIGLGGGILNGGGTASLTNTRDATSEIRTCVATFFY